MNDAQEAVGTNLLPGISELFEKYQKEFLRVQREINSRAKFGFLGKGVAISVKNQNTPQAVRASCYPVTELAKQLVQACLNVIQQDTRCMSVDRRVVYQWKQFLNDVRDNCKQGFCAQPAIAVDKRINDWFDMREDVFAALFVFDEKNLDINQFQDIVRCVPDSLQQLASFDALVKSHLRYLCEAWGEIKWAAALVREVLSEISKWEERVAPLTVDFNLDCVYEVKSFRRLMGLIETVSRLISNWQLTSPETFAPLRHAIASAQEMLDIPCPPMESDKKSIL